MKGKNKLVITGIVASDVAVTDFGRVVRFTVVHNEPRHEPVFIRCVADAGRIVDASLHKGDLVEATGRLVSHEHRIVLCVSVVKALGL